MCNATRDSFVAPLPPGARSAAALAGFFTLLLALVMSGCSAVSFVAPYDPVTDTAIQEVVKKTEMILSDATASGAGWSRYKEDYREVQGSLAAVALRAGLYGEKNKAEITVIANLQQAMRNVERLHRAVGSIRTADAEPVRSLLRSLMHHELSKKHSAALAAQGGAS